MPCAFRSISNAGKFRPPVPKSLLKDLVKPQPLLTGLSAGLYGI